MDTCLELSNVRLDPRRTTDCGYAVLQAYKDFNNQPFSPPPGYRYVMRFTGWDQLFVITGDEERYGLVFQSLTDTSRYLIAFRGTASMLDAYEDIWVNTVAFEPHQTPAGFPADVWVASGFWSVYSKRGIGMAASMQTQLFQILDKYLPRPPKTLEITGHSLGSALASLFALDVAVSRPGLTVINSTFASPRVGQGTWKAMYEATYGLQSSTYRIANWRDLVPTLPPKTLLGYEHVGQEFRVAFYMKDAWVPHYVSRHSMENYLYVVSRAVATPSQVWAGSFPDAVPPHHTMVSTDPPAQAQPEWAEMIHTLSLVPEPAG